MSPRFLTSVMLTALALSAVAEDDAVKMAGYHLVNRSSFTVPQTARAPFWPIGWVHTAKGQTQIATTSILDPQMFSVTSILLGHPSLAVINGRPYGEGEMLRSPRIRTTDANGKAAAPSTTTAPTIPPNVRIRVQRILDGSVVLVSDTQTLTIPLRRGELNDHKDDKDEELLLSGQN